jgi:splicing factor 3B subunit 1
MDATFATHYTREVLPPLLREFASPDEEMRRVVLRVLAQCAACEGVAATLLRADVLPPFFAAFWTRRSALDKRHARAVADTTLALALRVGAPDVLAHVSPHLKDESESFRRLAMEAVERVLAALGAADVPTRLEEELVDGALFAFQEGGTGAADGAGAAGAVVAGPAEKAVLSGFGVLVTALGSRVKPYLPQIAGTIKWRLNNKAPLVRMLAADLVARVAPAMRVCGEDALLAHLGVVLFESLGEEWPDVLGSLLGGLRAVVSAVGLATMQPPPRDLVPRLTPILKNRAEKVQEAVIELVGRIADRGADQVSSREWMRICFELLELLHAPRKSIRRAAVNTFGFIAKAIGPQDVMHALINNLKVQERTSRVCTTVAIGIIAETCAPFTVLPLLMNEYRAPDMNVQNGVLKALSFMHEYIGEAARDYVWAVAPLLADALMDRDAVHRQTACAAVKHLALGLQGAGAGATDALVHLLNYVWPNVFETSPHVQSTVFEAIEALRVTLGPATIFAYLRAGLFHPARRVRDVYWRIYNNLVVYSGHALAPVLPRIEDDDEAAEPKYRRTMLELVL